MNELKIIAKSANSEKFDQLITKVEKLEKNEENDLEFCCENGKSTDWHEIIVKDLHIDHHFEAFRATRIVKLIDYLNTGFYTGKVHETMDPKAKWFILPHESGTYFSTDFNYVKNMYLKDNRVLKIGSENSFNIIQFILRCGISKKCPGVRLCPNSQLYIIRKDVDVGEDILRQHDEDETIIVRSGVKQNISTNDVFVASIFMRVLNRNVSNKEVNDLPDLYKSKLQDSRLECVWGEYVIRNGGFSYKGWEGGRWVNKKKDAKALFKWPVVEGIGWTQQ